MVKTILNDVREFAASVRISHNLMQVVRIQCCSVYTMVKVLCVIYCTFVKIIPIIIQCLPMYVWTF